MDPARSGFGELTGPFFIRRGADGLWRGFRVEAKHANRIGIAHGGMLMSFADMVLGEAMREAGVGPAVTIRMVTDFVGPARIGDWVQGTGHVTRATASVVFVRGEVMANAHRILSVTGIFHRIRERR